MTFWIIAVTDGKEYIFLTLTSSQGAHSCVSLIVKIKVVTILPGTDIKKCILQNLIQTGLLLSILEMKNLENKTGDLPSIKTKIKMSPNGCLKIMTLIFSCFWINGNRATISVNTISKSFV